MIWTKNLVKLDQFLLKKTTFAPLVYKSQIILSDLTKLQISSYDLENGKIKLFFQHTSDNEPKNYSTPWSGAALDEKNGIYFLITEIQNLVYMVLIDQEIIKTLTA